MEPGPSQSRAVSVIRFGRSSVPPAPPKPVPEQPLTTCSKALLLKRDHEQLKSRVYLRHQEYVRTEKENKFMTQRLQDMEVAVKQQKYEVALLNEQLYRINREKLEIEAKLGQPSTPTSHTPSVVQFAPSSSLPSGEPTPKKMKMCSEVLKFKVHAPDLTKEPQIFCQCGVRFTTKQNLREHIKYFKFGMNFVCTVCGIRKHGLNQLRTHIKVTHGISSGHLDAMKGCRLCGQLFQTLAEIHDHRRIAHGSVRRRN